MKFFRVAWMILAVIVLDAAGIPHLYAQHESVYTRGAEVCSEDSLLTPEGARELEELGISRSFYAAYQGLGSRPSSRAARTTGWHCSLLSCS